MRIRRHSSAITIMKIVVQRVNSASVRVDGRSVGEIGRGLLLLVGIERKDVQEQFPAAVKKICEMRLFPDEKHERKFDRSLSDIQGELLIVSQFTLCADTTKGRRPDFFGAMETAKAKELYHQLLEVFRGVIGPDRVACGEFGAYMQVTLENDGPVTILLDM